jgi:hypothetical protein
VPKPADNVKKKQPADIYYETLYWYNDKVAKEKIPTEDQKKILQRIQAKFEPIGVDVSQVKEMIKKLGNEQK